MTTSEMNNEFVLLRRAVRRARIRTERKLVKEAHRLQHAYAYDKNEYDKNEYDKNERQFKKCIRESLKLMAEFDALRKIKNDDISIFGILNERSLIEILQDKSAPSYVRAMARVAVYKTLNRRLVQFKEKFPDWEKYIKNKVYLTMDTVLYWKTEKSKKNVQNKSSKKQKVDSNKNVEQNFYYISPMSWEPQYNKEEAHLGITFLDKQKLLKLQKDIQYEYMPNLNESQLCGITKTEAIVKKFSELLEENEANQHILKILNIRIEKKDRVTTVGEEMTIKKVKERNAKEQLAAKRDKLSEPNERVSLVTELMKPHNSTIQDVKETYLIYDKELRDKAILNYNRSGRFLRKHYGNFLLTKKIEKQNKKQQIIDETSLYRSWMTNKNQQEIMRREIQGIKIEFIDDWVQ